MPPAGHKEGSGVDEAEAEVLELLVMDMLELVEVGSETLKLLLDELVPIGKGGAVPWPLSCHCNIVPPNRSTRRRWWRCIPKQYSC